ncbi:MAG: hypothetical protein HY245_11370 [Rhizobiales bacterium]|nr:hypothetical protein [Hyphomicrobiales bacterium]MBI3673991.1 hypothetical protein [Hyphomicrobiales bacterium]
MTRTTANSIFALYASAYVPFSSMGHGIVHDRNADSEPRVLASEPRRLRHRPWFGGVVAMVALIVIATAAATLIGS